MYFIPTPVRSVKNYIHGIVVAAALFGPLGAAAQPVEASSLSRSPQMAGQDPASTQGWGVRLGYNSDYKRATLAYETPRLWAHQLQNGWGRVALNVELGASYWEARRASPKSMGQLSAIPTLRWWPNEGVYLEVGSGPTVLSRSEFAGRDLGTRLQFGSHLGAGMLIHKAHRMGIRYSHHSNAGLKKPNPGLDLIEVAYTYQF